ncbi:LysM peptidoglycan-binding domain-containing protein [Alicyclobacillus macrosporangiidus]|uniref:LysM peptidoglycan-binding domain-containing protein n=2 Tax=Alicyclobacillus macrosporangiidus TaxID=392015 RepID=UPI0018CC0525
MMRAVNGTAPRGERFVRGPVMCTKPDGRKRGRVLAAVILVVCGMAAWWGIRGSVAEAQSAPVWYTVQPGDTLWQVARETLPGVAPDQAVLEILRANGLATAVVRPGQTLQLPQGARLPRE